MRGGDPDKHFKVSSLILLLRFAPRLQSALLVLTDLQSSLIVIELLSLSFSLSPGHRESPCDTGNSSRLCSHIECVLSTSSSSSIPPFIVIDWRQYQYTPPPSTLML